MHTVPKIPGVELEVYKQNRRLTPEDDGYVGQLYSGFAVILAVIDPKQVLTIKTIGLFRDGQDHYILQKELLTLGDMKHGKFPITPAQQFMKSLLAQRSFEPETKVFGLKMPLRVWNYNGHPFNTVHYPENMLVLAQYCTGSTGPNDPGYILVWKVALVSQNGEFFLTVQEVYDVMICQQGSGKPRIPRLQGHRQLEQLLLANAPEDFRFCTRHDDPLPGGGDINDLHLGHNEGIVDRWYAARNMGCILTAHGSARVHWSDAPARPRLRFLKAGERVKFAKLETPPKNPGTDWRKVRKARFQLQVYGVEVS